MSINTTRSSQTRCGPSAYPFTAVYIYLWEITAASKPHSVTSRHLWHQDALMAGINFFACHTNVGLYSPVWCSLVTAGLPVLKHPSSSCSNPQTPSTVSILSSTTTHNNLLWYAFHVKFRLSSSIRETGPKRVRQQFFHAWSFQGTYPWALVILRWNYSLWLRCRCHCCCRCHRVSSVQYQPSFAGNLLEHCRCCLIWSLKTDRANLTSPNRCKPLLCIIR